ncbi:MULTISPECIES: cytochrome c [Dyella]|uniref:Cytochrome c n=2 Tax=Dyella TaxID=231454 RepID=A0A4R0YX30_9GAMM|nr:MULTISPECIES: cytochrome c [Dyella]TBR40614.1 cytochrome c [Dyella terrae]TCI11804.1 cytochrome c [Dyella soli]
MNTQRRSRGGRGWLTALIVIIVLVLLAWLATKVFRGGGDPGANLPTPVTDAMVKQGEYLARAGDCAACHTAPGGKPFAGGLPMASPVGTIYSSNITPDPTTGIGDYTYGDFERAVRRGISREGRTLYPAMPYPSYSRVSDQDIQALYAYFTKAVAPVQQANRKTDIPWPLSMHWPLTYWRWFFAPKVEPATTPAPDAVVARGAYLVEGLGHCGACHTPRAITLQEKALSDHNGKVYLSGGESDNWIVPSLRGEPATGLGSVSEKELVTLLRDGRGERSATFGGMADVVEHSTRFMNDDDLTAIARYLKALTPAREETAITYDDAAHQALKQGNVAATGAQLYVDNCAACHRTDGNGYGEVYPALAGNPVVNGDRPGSLIRMVLHGGTMPIGREAPAQFTMPPFDHRLTDEQVAQVVTFIRTSWGNRGAAVTAAQVHEMRGKVGEGKAGMTAYDPRRSAE